jgi:hypothetical protein
MEYGGEWIHGISNNAITEFVTKKAGLILDENPNLKNEPRNALVPKILTDTTTMMAFDCNSGKIIPPALMKIWFGDEMAPAPDPNKVHEGDDLNTNVSIDDQLSADIAVEAQNRIKNNIADSALSETLNRMKQTPKWKSKLEKLSKEFGRELYVAKQPKHLRGSNLTFFS